MHRVDYSESLRLRPEPQSIVTDERLLTAAEVSERLGFSTGWVLDHWEAGELPGFRLGRKGGPVRFRWDEIKAWLDTRRSGPTVRDGQLHEAKG